MTLSILYRSLTDVCDPYTAIEAVAIKALNDASASVDNAVFNATPLQKPFQDILSSEIAHPVCPLISRTGLPWALPETSDDAQYRRDSKKKMIVELIGPNGLMQSDTIRLGLYGILPGVNYGYRTHPAEEIFIMLAGEADWAKGDEGFITMRAGGRAHHPPMLRHATRTRQHPFMTMYIWRGDVSFDDYSYDGGMPS